MEENLTCEKLWFLCPYYFNAQHALKEKREGDARLNGNAVCTHALQT